MENSQPNSSDSVQESDLVPTAGDKVRAKADPQDLSNIILLPTVNDTVAKNRASTESNATLLPIINELATQKENVNLTISKNQNILSNEEDTHSALDNNGQYEDDIVIGRSVGAKAKNYEVIDPLTNERFQFSEGTIVKNPKVFAGKGGVKELDIETALGLADQIGGTPSNWQHCKGIGTIDYYGEDREAEVHWFQESTVGKHKFKIKKWLDE